MILLALFPTSLASFCRCRYYRCCCSRDRAWPLLWARIVLSLRAKAVEFSCQPRRDQVGQAVGSQSQP